jgi:thiamine biosynthesis lipoprotein ApbE
LVARLRAGASAGEPVANDLHQIARVLQFPSQDMAELRAGAELDAGGIGKGIALDAVAQHLRLRGARAAFLDFGASSILAFGPPEDRRAWSVAIVGECAGSILGTIDLLEGALSTSRAVVANDPAGAIIDPRTGAVVPGPRLATVLAANATDAEAWSKALVISGPEVLPLVRNAGIEALVVDGDGVTASPAFLRWLRADAAENRLNHGRRRSPGRRSSPRSSACNRPR